MATEEQSARLLRFAENAALLRLLNDVPYTGSPNHPAFSPNGHDENRALTFDLERGIACATAYLANISEDRNNVIATCVEETPGVDSLTVRLAINKGRSDDGEELLESIKAGLRDIFSVLARAGSVSQVALFPDVARAVLRLCRWKILLIIGSWRPDVLSRYTNGPGTWLGKTLKTVTDVVATGIPFKRIKQKHYPKAQSFVAVSRRLEALLEEVEACGPADLDQALLRVVETASQLVGKLEHLPFLLRNVSDQELQPSIHQGLQRRLKELRGYSQCWYYLCDVAIKTSLLEEVRVTSVYLKDDCFSMPAIAPRQFDLDACIARHAAENEVWTGHLTEHLNKPLKAARKDFATLVESTINDSKIHAEIQILTYYHLNSAKLPPRVIGSSKNACYLCDMLVRLHGQYALPGTHGRLYTKWMLPNLPVFGDLLDQINRNLESQISELCRENYTRAKMAINHPYEGPVLSLTFPISATRGQAPGAEPSTTEQQHLGQDAIPMFTTPQSALEVSKSGDNDPEENAIPTPDFTRTLEPPTGVNSPSTPVELQDDSNRTTDRDAPTRHDVSKTKTASDRHPLHILTWADVYRERHRIGPLLSGTNPRLIPAAQGCVVKLCCTTEGCAANHTADLLKMFTNLVHGEGTELHFERLSRGEARQAISEEVKAPLMVIEPVGFPAQRSEESADCILLRHGDDMIRMRRVRG